MSESMQHPRKLTTQQQALLRLIYKYRFATTILLAQNTHKKSAASIHPRLVTLEQLGYIGRYFNSRYRQLNRSAEYYLTPQGLRALKSDNLRGLHEKAIKNSYTDGRASKSFISRSLTIYEIAQKLEQLDGLRYFTKRELADDAFSYFPSPLPDGFMSWNRREETRRFFIEYIDETTPTFVTERLIIRYLEYAESGNWDVTGFEIPPVLLVAANGSTEKRLQKQITRRMDIADVSEPQFYTTTLTALKEANGEEVAIWSDVTDPDDLLSFIDLD